MLHMYYCEIMIHAMFITAYNSSFVIMLLKIKEKDKCIVFLEMYQIGITTNVLQSPCALPHTHL